MALSVKKVAKVFDLNWFLENLGHSQTQNVTFESRCCERGQEHNRRSIEHDFLRHLLLFLRVVVLDFLNDLKSVFTRHLKVEEQEIDWGE